MKTLTTLLLAALVAAVPAAASRAETRPDAAAVTVTLVRWPYT